IRELLPSYNLTLVPYHEGMLQVEYRRYRTGSKPELGDGRTSTDWVVPPNMHYGQRPLTEWDLRREDRKPEPSRLRTCACGCGERFTAKRSTARFLNDTHRKRALRARVSR